MTHETDEKTDNDDANDEDSSTREVNAVQFAPQEEVSESAEVHHAKQQPSIAPPKDERPGRNKSHSMEELCSFGLSLLEIPRRFRVPQETQSAADPCVC